ALDVAGRILALARERGQRPYEAWALRLLGEATGRRDPPKHADGRLREALALAEELGMRPLVARCHLGLGKLARRARKRPEAQDHLTTAVTMCRQMGMRFWLAQAEAEMGQLKTGPDAATKTLVAERRSAPPPGGSRQEIAKHDDGEPFMKALVVDDHALTRET